MIGDNDIFKAVRPERFQILGLELLPMSLGHYFTLRRLGCSFVSDENEAVTRDDLILSCLVCSMPHQVFDQWMESGCLSAVEKAWAVLLRITGRINKSALAFALGGTRWQYETAKWGAKVGVFDLEEKSLLFMDYLKESARFPKFWYDESGEGGSGSHWAHSVLITLMGQLGFTEERVKAMPLREALLHFFKYAETNGRLRLMTAEEIEFSETEAACPS